MALNYVKQNKFYKEKVLTVIDQVSDQDELLSVQDKLNREKTFEVTDQVSYQDKLVSVQDKLNKEKTFKITDQVSDQDELVSVQDSDQEIEENYTVNHSTQANKQESKVLFFN